jgi:hypothetical protein
MDEKQIASDTAIVADVTSSDVENQGWDAKSTKKLLRKLDRHIIPFMSLIYLYVLLAALKPSNGLIASLGYVFLTAPISAMPV